MIIRETISLNNHHYRLIAILLLATVLTSCFNHVTIDSVNDEASVSVSLEMEKATNQLILTSIAIGDRETFSELVVYPLSRPYPLHDINNQQEMIAYFDILFDDGFRKVIDSLNYNDWQQMGVQGCMILSGELWVNDGKVIAINYSSPEEQQKKDSLIFEEMNSLHPSLQGDWVPEDRLKLNDDVFSFARIDKSAVNDELFRLSLFAKNAQVGTEPAVSIEDHMEMEGREGATYCFVSNDSTAYFFVDFYAPPDSLKTLLWLDEKIPCQNHYYQ